MCSMTRRARRLILGLIPEVLVSRPDLRVTNLGDMGYVGMPHHRGHRSREVLNADILIDYGLRVE